MQTAEERIKFAVDLAAKNLDSLRDGDWLNLKQELGVFLHGERGFPQTRDSLGGIIVSAIERPLAQTTPGRTSWSSRRTLGSF